MKLFISWSGSQSLRIASILRDLLPEVLQDLRPWMSDTDIAAGNRWGQELSQELTSTKVGLLCLTAENLSAPWLLFEAGALAKTVDQSRVIPYRHKLAAVDVALPLAQFQGVDSTALGTKKLLLSLNELRDEPMPTDRLTRIFERWWVDFEAQLSSVPPPATPQSVRTDRELLEEVLQTVRKSPSLLPYEDGTFRGQSVHSISAMEILKLSTHDLIEYLHAISRRNSKSFSSAEHDHLDKQEAVALHALREALNRNDA